MEYRLQRINDGEKWMEDWIRYLSMEINRWHPFSPINKNVNTEKGREFSLGVLTHAHVNTIWNVSAVYGEIRALIKNSLIPRRLCYIMYTNNRIEHALKC